MIGSWTKSTALVTQGLRRDHLETGKCGIYYEEKVCLQTCNFWSYFEGKIVMKKFQIEDEDLDCNA